MGSNTPLFRKSIARASAAAAKADAQHTSLGALVYRKLREAIEGGELKPGQRIMEVEVAAWLKVSRTPVREALRRLESEGMLKVEPRMGLVVASLSRRAMLEDVWGVREDTDTRAIDNFIVRLRRYIEKEPSRPKHLLTVRGVGYRFVANPS